MKNLLLILTLIILVSCSKEESSISEVPIKTSISISTCDCKKIHNFYIYMNNKWVLSDTKIEDIPQDDCSLNGQFYTVMHDNGKKWSIKEDIITKCE